MRKALYGTLSAELQSATCNVGSHSVTCQPTLACTANQASTQFTYPRGMKGWVDLGVSYIPRWFACL